MDERMKGIIKHNLNGLCEYHDVELLFAVENGSRAWGLESKDSDYDIRFVFVRRMEDYLSINNKRDVIEYKENYYDMDFVGFDIYKFARLVKKSNPSMIEWLNSPIIYFDDGKTLSKFRDFINEKHNPKALYHHYRSMGKQNYLKYIKSGNQKTYKKHLYAIRGLLNSLYVAKHHKVPPMNFEELKGRFIDLPGDVDFKLNSIITYKKDGFESQKIQSKTTSNVLENFIERLLKEKDNVPEIKSAIREFDKLENYIIRIVKKNKLPLFRRWQS